MEGTDAMTLHFADSTEQFQFLWHSQFYKPQNGFPLFWFHKYNVFTPQLQNRSPNCLRMFYDLYLIILMVKCRVYIGGGENDNNDDDYEAKITVGFQGISICDSINIFRSLFEDHIFTSWWNSNKPTEWNTFY